MVQYSILNLLVVTIWLLNVTFNLIIDCNVQFSMSLGSIMAWRFQAYSSKSWLLHECNINFPIDYWLNFLFCLRKIMGWQLQHSVLYTAMPCEAGLLHLNFIASCNKFSMTSVSIQYMCKNAAEHKWKVYALYQAHHNYAISCTLNLIWNTCTQFLCTVQIYQHPERECQSDLQCSWHHNF